MPPRNRCRLGLMLRGRVRVGTLDETYMKNSPFTGPRFLFERREDVASDGGAAESSGTSEERRYVGMLMDRRGA